MRVAGLALALCLPGVAMAQQNAPLSAIDWLEQALTQPIGPSAPSRAPQTVPVAPAAPIVSRPLEQATLDSTGLFSASRIGLPRELWGQTPVAVLAEGIAALDANMVPAAQRMLVRLLTAEFAPPLLAEGDAPGALLLARLDKLIEIGALEQASQLIEGAPTQTAALNTRAFDIALLLGEEDRACARLEGQLAGTSGEAARIFCLARRGEWQSAYASLGAARALGAIDSAEAQLLERFLEEEDAEHSLPPPQRLSPMGWRVLEALGESVGTSTLPVAFAHADLRGTSGWRAQIDAAERLTRTGVMQPERLMGIYSQRRAAASGGVWDRVRAVQALDAALVGADTAAIESALRSAWPLFEAVEMESAFARIFAERLADHSLTGPAARVQWTMLLLAETRLDRAATLAPATAQSALALALASGAALPDAPVPGFGPAIQAAFNTTALPSPESLWLAQDEHGRLLLDTLALIGDASQGDMLATEQSLAALLALGLERDARQIAVELLLLERRG
ncbi:MAG: hypothetical protein JXQ79_05230 [Rhodobacteraceae bacterium]|nr:hypothetical protein [Paracoccaceae bacterium]